jgi:heme exporter protein A
MAEALLSIKEITKNYGARRAVVDASLELVPGECLALVGPNGAGKSTLLRLAAGLVRPSHGRVHVKGMELEEPEARRKLGFLGHEPLLYMDLTAEQNLSFFAALYEAGSATHAAEEALHRWGLGACRGQPLRALSKGQRQRAALARVFLHDPGVLLLDEPFSGLDEAACLLLEEELRARTRRGAALLWVSHEAARVGRLGTGVVEMKNGRLSARRAPAEGRGGAAPC